MSDMAMQPTVPASVCPRCHTSLWLTDHEVPGDLIDPEARYHRAEVRCPACHWHDAGDWVRIRRPVRVPKP